jgi:hypothetical protein
VNDTWQLLGFVTNSSTPAQQKYSARDSELFAMHTAVKRFRHAVKGINFVVYTNHKPFMYAFNQNLDKCSPRQFRHLDYIGQFTTDIRYIRGQDNNVADALSRIEAIGKSVDIKVSPPRKRRTPSYATSSTPAHPAHALQLKIFLITTWKCIATYQATLYDRNFCGLSHLGIRATQNLATMRFVWLSIIKDCWNWSRQCVFRVNDVKSPQERILCNWNIRSVSRSLRTHRHHNAIIS